MEHYFELPITYNGEERNYKGRLVTFGYVYKFHIVVDGRELIFEKDDEGLYRVLVDEMKEEYSSENQIDTGLIQAIIASLNSLSGK